MGFKILLAVLLVASFHLQCGNSRMTLSVKDFLNHTNGDQTEALQNAWRSLCGSRRPTSLVIHAGETYITRPQRFQGPCASNNLHIQIDGTIEAPRSVQAWGSQRYESWLWFDSVTGLVIEGTGLLDPHGESWWQSPVRPRPHTLMFNGCKYLTYKGITQRNSPSNHISISSSTTVTIAYIHIIAPENSPNTDGIDIAYSSDIHILSSTIGTGDDCIALNAGSHNINITNVECGPGHGISIGSLGKGGANDVVQDVNVKHCTFKGTQNGARIKTWPNGQGGYAKNILFEDITLIGSSIPINIDQKYVGHGGSGGSRANSVKVSDVTFARFRGTCANGLAIKLDCDMIGCDNILLEHINIASSSAMPLYAYCHFAHVSSRDVSVDVKCSFNQQLTQLQLPSPSTQNAQPPANSPYIM